jgi:hypothetical protein
MLSQQTTSTPTVEHPPEMQIPTAPRQNLPEYNDQYIELLASRLIPRLMPEILYHLRNTEPYKERSRAFGMSLALAIVSIVLMVPLTAIILGAMTTLGGSVTMALIGLAVVGLVMVLINVLFNILLFNTKS